MSSKNAPSEPGPCSRCGKDTMRGFDEYGGGWTYRCETCPQPRQVLPHTPGWKMPRYPDAK